MKDKYEFHSIEKFEKAKPEIDLSKYTCRVGALPFIIILEKKSNDIKNKSKSKKR